MGGELKLNERQDKFVLAYLATGNAMQSAITAGYSETYARSQSYRVLENVGVQAAIMAQRAHRTQMADISAGWVLSRLAELSEVRVTDLFDDDGELLPLSEIPDAAQRLITGIDVTHTRVGRERTLERTSIKLSDRLRVLDMIGKHVDISAWKESNGNAQVVVIVKDFTGVEHERGGNGRYEEEEHP